MADCMYHGYSGGPGPCPDCQYARAQDIRPELVTRPADEMPTQEETIGRQKINEKLASKEFKDKH